MGRLHQVVQGASGHRSRTRARPWWRAVILAFWLGLLVGTVAGRVPLAAGGSLEKDAREQTEPCSDGMQVIEVQAGDTLWSLARDYVEAEGDTRAGVDLLAEMNDLSSCVIQPGQVLVVPPGPNALIPAGHKPTGSESMQEE